MGYYAAPHDCIDYFREEYEFLSNFYPAKLSFDGITYLNAEAAYQAQKCVDPADRQQFSLLHADEAKRIGSKVALRNDWNEVRVSIMRRVVYAKFSQNPHLAQALIETGDTPLFEGNTWNDMFWGIDLKSRRGENNLGKILMELRAEFIRSGIPIDDTATARLDD